MAKSKQSRNDSNGAGTFSLQACKKILNRNGNQYADEEIYKIRDYLYQLVEIQVRHFKQWQAEQLSENSDQV